MAPVLTVKPSLNLRLRNLRYLYDKRVYPTASHCSKGRKEEGTKRRWKSQRLCRQKCHYQTKKKVMKKKICQQLRKANLGSPGEEDRELRKLSLLRQKLWKVRIEVLRGKRKEGQRAYQVNNNDNNNRQVKKTGRKTIQRLLRQMMKKKITMMVKRVITLMLHMRVIPLILHLRLITLILHTKRKEVEEGRVCQTPQNR